MFRSRAVHWGINEPISRGKDLDSAHTDKLRHYFNMFYSAIGLFTLKKKVQAIDVPSCEEPSVPLRR
jgi:hypothetical protein